MATTAAFKDRYTADRAAPICSLDVAKSFTLLRYILASLETLITDSFTHHLILISSKEKKYAHWLGKASWAGARIIQEQWTPQAKDLYDLLIITFSAESDGKISDLDALKKKSGVSEESWEGLLQYTTQVCIYNPSAGNLMI